ncbi:MAG: hypothetical protein WAM08_02815, partial [Candidatus Acidiferrales bacterium]
IESAVPRLDYSRRFERPSSPREHRIGGFSPLRANPRPLLTGKDLRGEPLLNQNLPIEHLIDVKARADVSS